MAGFYNYTLSQENEDYLFDIRDYYYMNSNSNIKKYDSSEFNNTMNHNIALQIISQECIFGEDNIRTHFIMIITY